MNSVMEIGEKVLFLENGQKAWEGSNQEIFKTEAIFFGKKRA